METRTLIYVWTLMTKHVHIFFDSLQIILRYEPSDLLRCAPNPVQNCHHQLGEVPPQNLNEPEPPVLSIAPRAARPCAPTTPSPKCALVYGSTHQMTSPRTRVAPYRADIMRGISGGAAIEYTDVDILPALPETMTIREHRPSLMRSPIPGESWQVTLVSSQSSSVG